MTTYTKALEDGRFEFGRIEYASDRRKDRMVPVGTADSFEAAEEQRKHMNTA